MRLIDDSPPIFATPIFASLMSYRYFLALSAKWSKLPIRRHYNWEFTPSAEIQSLILRRGVAELSTILPSA